VLKRAGKRTWRPERVVWVAVGGCGVAGVGRGVEIGAPAVGLIQHVGWLDPVGRQGDGLDAHKKLRRFLRDRTW
jgi:hypothetical protein